jgi:hypothetical protein
MAGAVTDGTNPSEIQVIGSASAARQPTPQPKAGKPEQSLRLTRRFSACLTPSTHRSVVIVDSTAVGGIVPCRNI